MFISFNHNLATTTLLQRAGVINYLQEGKNCSKTFLKNRYGCGVHVSTVILNLSNIEMNKVMVETFNYLFVAIKKQYFQTNYSTTVIHIYLIYSFAIQFVCIDIYYYKEIPS